MISEEYTDKIVEMEKRFGRATVVKKRLSAMESLTIARREVKKCRDELVMVGLEHKDLVGVLGEIEELGNELFGGIGS